MWRIRYWMTGWGYSEVEWALASDAFEDVRLKRAQSSVQEVFLTDPLGNPVDLKANP